MKTLTINKDNNYSLYNIENYRKELESDIGEVTKKYSELLIEYYKFAVENIKIKNTPFSRFIITRGLDTITNVFYNILYYTKNVDLTYFHCQKSFYFYVEFVGQISEDEKMFLQLTSRDATTYVYKKTIFEINNEIKKLNEKQTEETKNKLYIINLYINLYKIYLHKIIQSDINTATISLECFEKMCVKLNNISNKSKIKILENIVEKLYHIIDDKNVFFEINQSLVKKFIKNQDILNNSEKKIYHEDFANKLTDTCDKFVNWFIY